MIDTDWWQVKRQSSNQEAGRPRQDYQANQNREPIVLLNPRTIPRCHCMKQTQTELSSKSARVQRYRLWLWKLDVSVQSRRRAESVSCLQFCFRHGLCPLVFNAEKHFFYARLEKPSPPPGPLEQYRKKNWLQHIVWIYYHQYVMQIHNCIWMW